MWWMHFVRTNCHKAYCIYYHYIYHISHMNSFIYMAIYHRVCIHVHWSADCPYLLGFDSSVLMMSMLIMQSLTESY